MTIHCLNNYHTLSLPFALDHFFALSHRALKRSATGTTILSATGRNTSECSMPKAITRKTVLKNVCTKYAFTPTRHNMPRIVDRPPCKQMSLYYN